MARFSLLPRHHLLRSLFYLSSSSSSSGIAAAASAYSPSILRLRRRPTSLSNYTTFNISSSSNKGGGGGDEEFGFQRAEFRQEPLAGTVQSYDRHVFLCYQSSKLWPSHFLDDSPYHPLPLPVLLSTAINIRNRQMDKKTCFTICEGGGSECSDGDVLIFPDMIRYRIHDQRLKLSDVDSFIEEVLVKDKESFLGAAEKLTGSFIFVCSHGSRDRRCGVCGPLLLERFNKEIFRHGVQGQVSVSPCSHIGGHKYAGNVIIFSPNMKGEIAGHWYGYVSPDDVPLLLEHHIEKGEIVEHLWRGQMGLSKEDQKKAQNLRLLNNGESIHSVDTFTNDTRVLLLERAMFESDNQSFPSNNHSGGQETSETSDNQSNEEGSA